VEISYGPGGVSRGIATITFVRGEGATKAVEALNGLLVDNKPMKIDVLLDARRAAAIPPPKGLSERIVQSKATPKVTPKSAAATKATTVAGTGVRGKLRGRRGRNPRPTKKTAEELDSEMADYWESGANVTGPDSGAATNGAAQAPANGDAAMDDEIL